MTRIKKLIERLSIRARRRERGKKKGTLSLKAMLAVMDVSAGWTIKARRAAKVLRKIAHNRIFRKTGEKGL